VAKQAAFEQVTNYFHQNQSEMARVIQTEVDVSLEKENYILAGKVDLLLGGDGKLELLDFKTSPRPKDSPELIQAYERQLCTYAHILERRHSRHVDRLMLYWTSETLKKDALMVLPYDPKRADEAGRHFDETVRRIQAQDFAVHKPPEAAICKECDLRMLCHAEGVISREARG
jgi:DNA helicase-2/ATP-dependent DNA helicase PcrA